MKRSWLIGALLSVSLAGCGPKHGADVNSDRSGGATSSNPDLMPKDGPQNFGAKTEAPDINSERPGAAAQIEVRRFPGPKEDSRDFAPASEGPPGGKPE